MWPLLELAMNKKAKTNEAVFNVFAIGVKFDLEKIIALKIVC